MPDLPAPATTGDLDHWHAAGFPAICTPTGLALPDGLDHDSWAALGPMLLGAVRASMWWIGDWINHGRHTYGAKYTAALELTGLSYTTLANAANVAGRVEFSRRRENLDFWHHAEVVFGAKDETTWDAWFERAVSEGLTRSQLRAEIRKSQAVDTASSDTTTKERPVRIRVDAGDAPVALGVLRRAEEVLRGRLSDREQVVLHELAEALGGALSKQEQAA